MPINYDEIMSMTSENVEISYSDKDSILYSLGVGLGNDPMNMAELKYVYENSQVALPSMATNFQYHSPLLLKANINFILVVHGEQKLSFSNPLPVSGDFISNAKVIGCYDKGAGKGAIIDVETTINLKKDNTEICKLVSTTFARGDGGFGGPESPKSEIFRPEGDPDFVHEIKTKPDQALIFRLSGDYNPLHSDPNFAKTAGFEKPILHGMCTYGIACRSLVESVCEGDAKRLKKFDCRFSSPVYPGETIVTEMWKNGSKVYYQSKVKERDKIVIKNGVSEIT
ncbi:MAG: MaoC/PaaZ C-terminal domain-containing protein [Candidatus Pelagibacterales bacterium]